MPYNWTPIPQGFSPSPDLRIITFMNDAVHFVCFWITASEDPYFSQTYFSGRFIFQSAVSWWRVGLAVSCFFYIEESANFQSYFPMKGVMHSSVPRKGRLRVITWNSRCIPDINKWWTHHLKLNLFSCENMLMSY